MMGLDREYRYVSAYLMVTPHAIERLRDRCPPWSDDTSEALGSRIENALLAAGVAPLTLPVRSDQDWQLAVPIYYRGTVAAYAVCIRDRDVHFLRCCVKTVLEPQHWQLQTGLVGEVPAWWTEWRALRLGGE